MILLFDEENNKLTLRLVGWTENGSGTELKKNRGGREVAEAEENH